MKGILIPKEAAGMRLSDYLNQNRYANAQPCGGKGTCGKCRVKLLEGSFGVLGNPTQTLATDENGMLLACRALCRDSGAVIALPSLDGEGLVISEDGGVACYQDGVYAVAFDVGTTTLAAALVETRAKKVLTTASALNPQLGFGSDVMSRIAACEAGHLKAMQTLLLDELSHLLQILLAKAELSCNTKIRAIAVAGNPTMLHIFCGVSPCGMGRYPFTPSFLETKCFYGYELGLSCEKVIVLPSASAFIGSDVLGGALTQSMLEKDEPTLLLDIGTNGEMLLCSGKKRGNRLFAASAAAGPAFEGANISCGMGGVSGAVCRIEYEKGDHAPVFFTVGDEKPKGICGSGLVDFAAYLLKSGQMDETGYTEKETIPLLGYHSTKEGKRFGKTHVFLTDRDIRALQLAKSAIRAAIETLADSAELSLSDIAATYLAGGLGYYIDRASAALIGLLPKELLPSAVSVGNTALAGAVACLFDEEQLDRMRLLGEVCHTVELNDIGLFSELFMEHMTFPCDDET